MSEEKEKKSWIKRMAGGLDFRLMSLLMPYLKQYKKLIWISLLTMLLADILGASVPLFIKRVIDTSIAQNDLGDLYRTVTLLAVALFLSFVFRVIANYGVAYLGQKLLFALRKDLFQKVLSLANDFFDRVPTGTTLTHVTNDVENVRQFISEGIVAVISGITKVVIIMIFMFYINAYLALVTLACIPLFAISTYWFKTRIRSGFREVRKANSDINTKMVESLNGYREIALFQNRKVSEARFDVSNDKYLNAYHVIVGAYALYLPIIENITHLSTLVILLSASFGMGAKIEPGDIFAFFTLINMFFRPLREVAEQFNTFQSAMAAMERIEKLLEENVAIASPPKPQTPQLGESVAVDFHQVDFAYIEGQNVLEGLNFSLKPGEKLALVGSTGSGKSTIIHLINRLYDVNKGRVSLNGVDVRDWDLQTLREQVATIPQHVFLFTGTILDNIRLFDESIGTKEVQKAIDDLELNDFIDSLPGGLDYEVLEEGSALSNGQKQLLAFARAYVKNPALLILDEATASVDSSTEKQLEQAQGKLLATRSAIIIAHRLSTIQSADRILVLNHGHISESGKHEELIQANGLYRKLYEMQSISLSVGV
ncbi:MAG: ABC transporter ATP-binding protein [Planctomycetes bacterium]|nr:ABC transporter ATP-binding protein [Planctomycetota bacterium]